MNDSSMLTADGRFASESEITKRTQQEFGSSREMLLGHLVLTLLFLVAVLLRAIL